jgi:hypothetical protein
VRPNETLISVQDCSQKLSQNNQDAEQRRGRKHAAERESVILSLHALEIPARIDY